MNLKELTNDQTISYRIGRAGEYAPDWNEWTTGKIYLRRRDTDLPAKFRKRNKFWRAGTILTLALKEVGWAEYGEYDYCGSGVFVAEDYYLEIEGLKP